MQPFILLAIMIYGLIVAGLGIVLVVATRNARTVQAAEAVGKRPQGYWLSIGIASGLPIGYLLALIVGILTDNVTSFIIFGPALGMLLGVAVGAALEQKHKDDVRPLTAVEQRVQMWASLGLLILGLFVLAGVILLAAR